MATRQQLQVLADTRLVEAQALLAVMHWPGAYYLAGYAIEMAIKACFMARLRPDELPTKKDCNNFYTHEFGTLLNIAGLTAELNSECDNNTPFADNWAVTKDWNEQSRYEQKSQADAEALLQAISDPQNGVLSWIKSRW